MPDYLIFLMLISLLWIFGGIILGLHRLSVRIGLVPLLVFLGGITAAMQLQSWGWIHLQLLGYSINLDSLILFPALLFGALVIYVVNGTVQARSVFVGVMLISAMAIGFQLMPKFLAASNIPGFQAAPQGYPLRVGLASLVALVVDVIVLVVVYQMISNARRKYPSRVAGSLALLSALLSDAILFPLLAFFGTPNWPGAWHTHLLGKLCAGLVLLPLLIFYLRRVAPILPGTAATGPRPVFDLFTTNLQLETRALYHYNLLRTMSQLNQLIARSTNADELFQKVCDALIELRPYRMIWIGLIDEGSGQMKFTAQAGFTAEQVEAYAHHGKMIPLHQAAITKQALIINDVNQNNEVDPAWKKMMLATGCYAAGIFPIRSLDHIWGAVNVCMDRTDSFDRLEINLLQELADDLAYALANLEVRAQQTLLQAAAETMQDGIVITDFDGNMVYVNPSSARMMHASPSDLLGKPAADFIFSSGPPVMIQELIQTVKSQGKLKTEFVGRKAVSSVNVSIALDSEGQPAYLVSNVRDVTEQRAYERQLLTLHQLTTELVQIRDTPELMEAILHTSEDLLQANASGIYFVDPEHLQITDTLAHNLNPEYIQRIARDYRGLPGGDARKTLQPVSVNDVLQSEIYGERIHFMAEFNIRALIVLPIIFQEKPFGALTLYYQQPHQFSAAEIQIGKTLVQTLAIVMQNARLYQGEREQRELAEALVNAAASINSSLELEEVLAQILDQVMRVIPCKAANIMLIENDMAYIHTYRGYENQPDHRELLENMSLPLTTKNLATIIRDGEPYLISDTSQDANWVVIPGSEWVKGNIGVPLKAGQNVIGFLNIDSDKAGLFTEETVHQLQIFVDYATTAIINARLYKAEHNQRELAEALALAAASVSSSLELADVLDQILAQAMRVVPCQAANIMLIDGNKLKMARHRGYGNYISDTTTFNDMEFSIDWPGLHEMYTQGKPVIMPDTHSDERWQSTAQTNWVRSFIGIPLLAGRDVVGFLNIDSDKANFLTDQYLPRLQTFADYASTAIKNARTYEKSLQRAEEMAALVTAASAVSKSIEFKQVLKIIAEQMTKVLKVKACAISNYDSELNQVTLLMEYGTDEWEIGAEWYQPYDLVKYPLTKQVLENNEPLHLRISDAELDESERKFMESAKIETLLMLPLVNQDRVIGLVELMDTQKERDFSVRGIALGLSLATHAAAAIENADLYSRLQTYASELEQRVDRRTRQLQAATESIEGILASIPDAIFVLDQNQELVRANQAGEKLIYQASTTGLDLFNPELLQTLENSHNPQAPAILHVQGKTYQMLASQMAPNEEQTGEQIILFRDVTHFQELDQMKTQFVSDVSHELRTPLTNLTLYLALLTTVRDPQKQNDYILILQRETDRLTHLIEDLLTISRLEASRVQVQIRATNLNQLVEDLVYDRFILAAQKNIVLDFAPAADLPLAAVDGNLLTQGLSNLLTNAINYTLPEGKIHASTLQLDPHWVAIQISDTGVGISSEETERIFDRFYRGRASQLTGAEGTGLGLAISQEIIQRLGGKITLESTPGEGSTFTIWLKIATTGML